jgi:hypothetical protein
MFNKKNVNYERLVTFMVANDTHPNDLNLGEILCDDRHPFWAYATQLYGALMLGRQIQVAGGDVLYRRAHVKGMPIIVVSYPTLVGIGEPISLGDMLTDWLCAYNDEGSVMVAPITE